MSVTDILAATAYIAPAMEAIDSRYRDFKFTLADVIADNSSSSRYIYGEKFYRVDADLRLMGMVFKKNGEIIATSAGVIPSWDILQERLPGWPINWLREAKASSPVRLY